MLRRSAVAEFGPRCFPKAVVLLPAPDGVALAESTGFPGHTVGAGSVNDLGRCFEVGVAGRLY
jgi:hypothetical protein